ncbi:MAG: hypothetical protein OES32_05230 [Acidobacteriota bacterium]|nr:hypothetical protein [Acidobacteriota bacterium]MDH3522971.1 hypothetical protein [Acidobacteriota bacterium]
MSEPQTPPPPPTQQPAQKKGLSPVAWILIGCLGLLVLVGLGMGACALFVGSKVKDFAEDMSENPARTAAEMVVRFNPDLEIVSTDDEAETITIREKETGKEMTFDWSQIQEGNFSFKTDEGELRVNASGDEEGAVLTMTDGQGETAQIFGGGAAAEVPDWIPLAGGATDVQSTFSMASGGTTSGAFTYSTSSSVDDVASFYENELTEAGYEVGRSTYSAGGTESASVTANTEGNGRTVLVAASRQDGTTQVVVNYTDGG